MARRERYEGRNYIWRILIAIDQLANVVFLNGYPDETISSRAGKALLRIDAGVPKKNDHRWCLLCKMLDWIDPGHCRRVIELDEGKEVTHLK